MASKLEKTFLGQIVLFFAMLGIFMGASGTAIYLLFLGSSLKHGHENPALTLGIIPIAVFVINLIAYRIMKAI